MSTPLRLISSMATRALLADLLAAYEAETGHRVDAESVGGVDAAKRVLGGEAFDVVMLASGALDQLAAAGRLLPDTRVDIVRSGVSVAVREGAPVPDLHDEAALRQAVISAPSLSYSTGPSGVHLQRLFERWGIAAAVADRVVQAAPGVPVASLVADGRVALGFQQLSELLHVRGITIAGPLPPACQVITVFGAAACAGTARVGEVQALLRWMTSPATAEAKRRQGMEHA